MCQKNCTKIDAAPQIHHWNTRYIQSKESLTFDTNVIPLRCTPEFVCGHNKSISHSITYRKVHWKECEKDKRILLTSQSLDDNPALPTCPVCPFSIRNSIMMAFTICCCLFASKRQKLLYGLILCLLTSSRGVTHSWIVADSDVVLLKEEGLKPSASHNLISSLAPWRTFAPLIMG